MNKTVTANISGVVFHIEADAYDKLHHYLNTIRNYFHDSDGKDEIMADIEARIAELFNKALENGKEVITMLNVNEVIEVMGEPEAYVSEDEEYAEESKSSRNSSSSKKFYSKKLYRDDDDNLIGGVCSGIGYYFGIDKIWLRAGFLIAFFGFGTGLLVYLILWIIIPSAKTTAEKLEMKGEPINVDSIGNAIKDEFNSFKKKVNKGETAEYGEKAKHGIYRFFEFFGKILYYAALLIVKVIAVLLVIAAALALISYLIVLSGGPFDVGINDAKIDQNWFSEYANLFFSSDLMYGIGLVGISLVVLMPVLGILYGGLKLLLRFKGPQTKAFSLTAISLFVVGVILIFISATSTARQFSSNQTFVETVTLNQLNTDTLELNSLKTRVGFIKEHDNFFIEDDTLYLDELSVDVIPSNSDFFEINMNKEAHGASRKQAGELAKNISPDYRIEDNKIFFSNLIAVPVTDKFRKQEIQISIGVPIGKVIYLDQSARRVIYDIENVTNTYDDDMLGHHWLMTSAGLKCMDCNWLEDEEFIEEKEFEEVFLKEAELELERAKIELKRAEKEIKRALEEEAKRLENL